jgi:formylglycine-generating enzyme required for sulfatase activity
MTARSLGDEISAQLGGEGRAVLTASTAEQFALEREGSGIYTRYLVEGIETGAADADSNGVITIAELHEYAKRKVKEAAPAMTPEIYAVREGYSIQLAKASIGDPRLKYRKEVEAIAQRKNGGIDFLDRRILSARRNELKLSLEDVQAIEAEVLQPFEALKQKLQEYQEALQEVIERETTISDERWEQLKYFRRVLQLRDEDVAVLENELMAQQRTVLSIQSQPQKEPKTEEPVLVLPGMQSLSFDVMIVDAQGKEIDRQRQQAEYFVEDLGNGVTLEMVSIPAGEFLMGSPEKEEQRFDPESPQHSVKVPSCFMGKFEVTQAQWAAVAKLPKVKIDLNPDPAYFKGAKRPVERVSWLEAVEFCDRLSQKTGRLYRLPSEAEWEYACRAGTTTPFHFGATITTDLANFDGNYTYAAAPKGKYLKQTTEVGSFPPNSFGLYDLHGNVYE